MEADEIVKELAKEEANAQCFDCDKTPVEWASINNAVFLCAECAHTHEQFGENISEVVHIGEGVWTDDDVCLLKSGGNQALRDFFAEYTFEGACRYRSKAASYYRELVRALADQKKLEKPSPEEGAKLIADSTVNQSLMRVFKKSKRFSSGVQRKVSKSPHYRTFQRKKTEIWGKTREVMDPHLRRLEAQTAEVWGKARQALNPHIEKLESRTSELWGKTREAIEHAARARVAG